MTSPALRKLDKERLYNIMVAVGALLGDGAPTWDDKCWYCGAIEGREHYHGCAWQHLNNAYHLRLDLPSEEATP